MKPFVVICSLFCLCGIGYLPGACAEEEVTTFTVRWNNTSVHGVADVDAEKGWMTHHIFPSKMGVGISVARDEKANVEVFRPDKHGFCYVRPIPKWTRNIWQFKSILHVFKQHKETWDFKNAPGIKEYVECTGEKVDQKRLGKVASLCKDAQIYALRKMRRAKRAAEVKVMKAGCGFCLLGCWGRKKREIPAMADNCRITPRTVYIKTCSKD